MRVDRQVCFVGAGACALKWRPTGVERAWIRGRRAVKWNRRVAMRCGAEMRTADARREEVDYCQKGGRNATSRQVGSSSCSGVAAVGCLVASTSRCRS